MSQSETGVKAENGKEQQYTTVTVTESTRELLENKKPFPSISLNDLIADMAKRYEPEVAQ